MHTWNDVLSIALGARWPTTTGKPLENNTYMILSCDKNEEPTQVRLKYHRTDIVVWKPNDDVYICTGWESQTTKERLNTYAGTQVFTHVLPALNGYKVSPEKATILRVLGIPGTVPFDGNASPSGEKYARENYIRIADGRFDMATVNAIRVQCVVEPEKLRRCMRHLGKVARLALGYAKLKGADPFKEGGMPLTSWLMERHNVPLEEVKLSPLPSVHGENIRASFDTALKYVRLDIARGEGWLGAASMLKNV